jgi:hypothetical protein
MCLEILSNFVIYKDDVGESDWFKRLNHNFKSCEIKTILKRTKNIPIIEDLVKYDKPDIILLHNNKPVLVLEKSQEVPTGHNVGQRLARLVRAVEKGVPTIYFWPFDAMKHGKFKGMCNLNARILLTFEKMWEMHDCPIIAVNWRSDKQGELIKDGTENEELKKIISELFANSFKKGSLIWRKIRENNKNEYTRRIRLRGAYGKPPSSVCLCSTEEVIDKFKDILNEEEIKHLKIRDRAAVYKIEMTEEKCHRQDPYTGTQFMYDYCYCRNGPTVNMKHTNLLLHFPKIEKEFWIKSNPNDNTKSSNWYLTANALIFSDGIILLR